MFIDTQLRWKLPTTGAVHARPVDDDRWLIETSCFDGQLDIPVMLQLNGASEWANKSLRLL
jgi:hypothetical protein